MSRLVKNLSVLFLVGTILLPSVSSAQSVADLQAQIQALLAQIQQLQAQLSAQGGGGGSGSGNSAPPIFCYSFRENLRVGDKNSAITSLQTALEKEGFSISNDIDGVFGEGTASAVSGFQEKYRSEILNPVELQHGNGYVGRLTRAKLNSLFGCAVPPTISPIIPTPGTGSGGGSGGGVLIGVPMYSAYPTDSVVLGNRYDFYAKVTNAKPNSKVLLYLQRPDGSMKYNGVSDSGEGSGMPMWTDANGNWSRTQPQILSQEGKQGTWVSWVRVADVNSNRVYHNVTGSGGGNISGTVSEQVKCIFSGSTAEQKCYTATDYVSPYYNRGCSSGAGACVVDLNGPRGDRITWKSSCGGYAYTTMDGASEYANFNCGTSVIPMSIAVLSPNGGEAWEAGKTYVISYYVPDTNAEPSIYLERYHEAGSGKTGVNSSLLIGQPGRGVQSFSYTVPSGIASWPGLGGNYRIKVCVNNCASSDSSNMTFSIVAPMTTQPSIAILSPNGGETWQLGSTQIATWNATALPSITNNKGVSLGIVNSQGAVVSILGSFPTALGQNSVAVNVVPSSNTPIPSGQYRMRINFLCAIGATDPACYLSDDSDAPFSIVAPITVSQATFTGAPASVTSGNTVTFSWTNAVAGQGLTNFFGTASCFLPGITMYDVTNNRSFLCGDVDRPVSSSGSDTIRFTSTNSSAIQVPFVLQYGNGQSLTQMITVMSPASNGTILGWSVDPGTPPDTTVVPGQTGVTLAKFRFTASGGNVKVTSVFIESAFGCGSPTPICANSNARPQNSFSNLRVYDGSALLGSTSGFNLSSSGNWQTQGAAQFDLPSNPLMVPMNGSKVLTLVADIPSSANAGSGIFILSALAAYDAQSGAVAIGSATSPNFSNVLTISPQQQTQAAGSLQVFIDAATPASNWLTMGSVGNPLAMFRFAETSGNEDIKITDLTLVQQITQTGAKSSFNNMSLYNGSTLVGVSGAASSLAGVGYTYTFHFAAPITVPRANALSLTLKGDVYSYASAGATDNSNHLFSTQGGTNGSVTAIGSSSNTSVNVTYSNAFGKMMTILRSKLTVTATPMGATTGRAPQAIDDLASINFTADPAGPVQLNKVTLTFQGLNTGTNLATNANSIVLYDPTNGTPYTKYSSTPTSVTFDLQGYMMSAGTTKSFTLRVNSAQILPLPQVGVSPTLVASIAGSGDVQWTDGLDSAATANLNLLSSMVPLQVASVTYASGVGGSNTSLLQTQNSIAQTAVVLQSLESTLNQISAYLGSL